MARIGVRNVARRKARSLSAVAQVALGIGAAIGFGAFALTGVSLSSETLAREGSDITVYGEMRILDPEAAGAITGLSGVAAVQPTVDARARYDGGELTVRGLPVDPIYDPIPIRPEGPQPLIDEQEIIRRLELAKGGVGDGSKGSPAST